MLLVPSFHGIWFMFLHVYTVFVMEPWNFSSQLQLAVVGWVLGGPKANSTCEFLVSLDA